MADIAIDAQFTGRPIWILGGHGKLAKALMEFLNDYADILMLRNVDVIACDHQNYDVTSYNGLVTTIRGVRNEGKKDWPDKPSLILNCAAVLSLPSETDRNLAWRVNAVGARNVAQAANLFGIRHFYVSSEYVFGGENALYAEDAEPDPINFYGYTKAQGEVWTREYDGVVVRVPFRAAGWKYHKAYIDHFSHAQPVDMAAVDLGHLLLHYLTYPWVDWKKRVFHLIDQDDPGQSSMDYALQHSEPGFVVTPALRHEARMYHGIRLPRDTRLSDKLTQDFYGELKYT